MDFNKKQVNLNMGDDGEGVNVDGKKKRVKIGTDAQSSKYHDSNHGAGASNYKSNEGPSNFLEMIYIKLAK